MVNGVFLGGEGQDLALTVLCVPYSCWVEVLTLECDAEVGVGSRVWV